MNDTITTYKRRSKHGVKETTVKTDTWFASVLDFAPTEKREWGFTTVDVHCNRLNSDQAEIRVKDFTMDGDQPSPSPFYTVDVGGAVAVTLYLSPEQAKTLAVQLSKATGTTWLPGATW
jgi:hypothetical protein